MATVEIYSSPWCGYCARAKTLLDRKGVAYTDIDVDADTKRRDEMTKRAGGRTSVPQIFIDGVHVGGCDELYALDRARKLDPMLEA
ncbi:glutaredoxin 3 [Stella humosa]|uniref:Glutaredoxin n=1 Tax=Stella humosa TaxID=94 RepID=A0A3N1M9T2_9PROT|nr:glutaredoxin 3 [Stella humosa]ROP99988.1 glutaredoxin 3 [Stella humosa]BBK30781.1 glutaredoxin 3 [Stella humosa]